MDDQSHALLDIGTLPASTQRCPERELRESLTAENRTDLLVAASYAPGAGVVTLYRDTLVQLVVPAAALRAKS